MKAKDLRMMNDAELVKELLEVRKEQFSLRMQLATQQLANVSLISKLRKNIARIKTIQRERAFIK